MVEKISIITISFNSEKTIEKTFCSILSQAYRPLEYILVDGGSKDGTIKLIKKYLKIFKNNGIEVNFKSEPDKGISDAFNKGIERANGDIIGIINSDDCLADNALNYVAESFDSNIDVVCGDCLWIDEENALEYIRKSKLNLDKLKYRMVLMHPTCFVRKRTYNQYGKFDTNLKYAMDKDLMARFHKNDAKFKYVPQVISIMTAGGVSDVNTRKVFKEGIEIAVRNGVPHWKAVIVFNYNMIKTKIIKQIKQINKLRKGKMPRQIMH